MKQFFLPLIFIFFIGNHAKAQSTTNTKLIAFAKLYSTIKFYYPDPHLKDFPWNAVAFKGYEIASQSKTDEAFLQQIKALFKTIAPGVQMGNSLKFNLSELMPKNEREYPTTKFWQHQVGLNVNRKSSFTTSTLNYIYQQRNLGYKIIQTFNPRIKGMLGKKVRVSFWAKWEGDADTALNFFQMSPYNRKTKTFQDFIIKTTQRDWTKYEKEFDYPEDIAIDKLLFFIPIKGTIYVDDLVIEKFENETWQKIEFANTGFENYTSLGNLGGWEDPYTTGSLVEKSTFEPKEGKFVMRLSAVQDNIYYKVPDVEKPFEINLLAGYNAFVPLQLRANDSIVYPNSNQTELITIANSISKSIDSSSSNRNQAIACAFEIWSQFYHDYPYRENNFEIENNANFLKLIAKIEDSKKPFEWNDFFFNYFVWTNDPHAAISNKKATFDEKRKFRIPVDVVLGEKECIVSKTRNTRLNIKQGDVISKINHMDIDSLLADFRTKKISKSLQWVTISKMLDSYSADSVEVEYISKNINKLQKEYYSLKSMNASANTPITKVETDSLNDENEEIDLKNHIANEMKTSNIFYFNAVSNDVVSRNVLSSITKMDSLIDVFNTYKYVIIDVRGRPNNTFLNYLQEFYAEIDLDKKLDILKKEFLPVANFKYQNVDLTKGSHEDKKLTCKIIYLVNYKTVSAPERMLLRAQASKFGTIIGENTAGAAGLVNKIRLTDRIEFSYTCSKLEGLNYMPNHHYQGSGIKPEIIVYQTAQGVKEGRDEVLEKAIEVIKKMK